MSWDEKFMNLALHIATWSKDGSTKVGCVIVDDCNIIRSTGYNGFPRNVDDNRKERHERPDKYIWTEHAERNAIYNAAKTGTSLSGCRMYLPWFPCIECARAIVQCGIKTLVSYEPDLNDGRWGNDFKSALEILKEGQVEIIYLENI